MTSIRKVYQRVEKCDLLSGNVKVLGEVLQLSKSVTVLGEV